MGYWGLWLAAPGGILAGSMVLGLDSNFIAVGLLYAAVVIIQMVQAWSRQAPPGEGSPDRVGGVGERGSA